MKINYAKLYQKFQQGCMVFGRGLVLALSGTANVLDDLNSLLAKEEYKQAEFGKETSIGTWFEKGFRISKSRRQALKKSFENVILYGQIGSGKTTRYILPIIYDISKQKCSAVITDQAQEIHPLTSGHANSQGKEVLILNYLNSDISIKINFLLYCKGSYSKVKQLSNVLVKASNKGAKSDPFWQSQSKIVLSVFMWMVLQLKDPKLHHMGEVCRLIDLFSAQNFDELDQLIVDINDEKLQTDYAKLLAMPEKTRQNVMASVDAIVEIFADPEIRKVVSASEEENFDFDRLRDTETFLYIQNSIGQQAYLEVLTSCFYQLLFSHLLENPVRDEQLDLFMIYEEFSSMYIPMLPRFLANNRKARIANFLCLQSISQLNHYGHDKLNITSNCVTQIILPGDHPMDFLREIEQKSGKRKLKDKEGNVHVTPLVSASEFRMWEANSALAIQGGKKYVKVKPEPYYRSLKYRSLAAIEPYFPERRIAIDLECDEAIDTVEALPAESDDRVQNDPELIFKFDENEE